MNSFRAVPLVLGLLFAGFAARAQMALPPEFRHVLTNDTKLNFQSQAGVPISTTVGNPPGSNGLQPTSNESAGSFATPTPKQFRGFASLGGVPGLKQSDWLAVSNSPTLQAGTTPLNALVADQMRLPRGVSTLPGGMIILRRAGIGMPYLSRQVSFSFGQVVPPPAVDETAVLLTGPNAGSYWLPEPHTTTGHTNAGYYWSRHGRLVYSIQPGPMQITWAKATPYNLSAVPVYTNPAGGASFRTNGANVFLLYTQSYLVSGSASKTPRKMYWTQKGFQNVGKPISVPAARVGAVNIVYNNNFPKVASAEYAGIGSSSPTDGTTNAPLPELRTLWYEEQQGTIYAYNAEGRVFVELLGDLRSDGQTYEQLGTEIVDVFKQPLPLDATIELGERIIPPEGGLVEDLVPEPLNPGLGISFAFRHNIGGVGGAVYYATRETRNVNDFLIHWMEAGEAGLMWPKLFGRYQLIWPNNVEKYSLYVRPQVATETEAQATSVLIDPENAPVIEYQDLPTDDPRAKFTPDLRFYTYLTSARPAHRTLLRYTGGEYVGFERVFSWLADNLRTTNYAGNAIVTNLTAWNGTTLVWPNELAAPRVINATVNVGERIGAPFGEPGYEANSDYLAGYIHRPVGTSYNPDAYKDPFALGFEAANLGSIIPVNAIPGRNNLEVWWFRRNATSAGLNAGNTVLGFRTIHWPAAIGRYTIQWPVSPREIVLASKLGGTGLTTAEQKGIIYHRNTKGETGYNPNEEHAIMSGGTPFATRDDLNIITQTNNEHSSHPFVLVSYSGNDGRPSMAAFKVLREKPEAGYVFDYIHTAGLLLQPPPPLTFLQKPVEGSGDNAVNYNSEPPAAGGDLPVGWTVADASGPYGHYQSFTYRDRKQNFWVYRGLHSGLPQLQAGTYQSAGNTFALIPNPTRARTNQLFSLTMHVSRQDEYMAMDVVGAPGWMSVNGLTISGTPPASAVDQDINLQLIVRDQVDLTRVTNVTVLQVRGSGANIQQAALTLVSSNAYTGSIVTYSNRPPFLAGNPAPTNSFTLRYYYKTEPSFAWPGISSPPATGAIVPYLRKRDASGNFVGAADSKTTASLDIVYRPVWPVRDAKDSSKSLPTLPFGATLAKPGFNLPGVRDFKTAHVLYQQSIAANLPAAKPSVVLHDPTVAKFSDVKQHFASGKIPASVATTLYQGKVYFPNLPPHLAERVFIDPNRGEKGQLVLLGQFKEEALGESYLQLNVIRGSDYTAVVDLCPTGDSVNRPLWVQLVGDLSTDVETFHENSAVPGTYIPNPARTVKIGRGDMVEIKNDNVAKDSYALTAVGPGQGYVTLLEASGTAFTQPGDPVALHIFKVGGSLYPGELKIIPSANPLSELLTLQHSGDFAGRAAEYEFEWRIAAPVDGEPPETPDGYLALTKASDVPRYTLGGAGIQALSDNYVIMRYRPLNTAHPLYKATPTEADWSPWTDRPPALAEGWIKRVLAGINPFGQRITDLFNNQVNTDVSLLTQAGRRWEGDIALNLDTINNYGLIEIYETVLRRGRSLSIESGYNYGPANDALLLAAGYLSDLYMFLGNEASADASNPTIGIGTADKQYGSVATALFSFKGQMPSVLEEELALLRGRDDFLLPGVEVTPVYNRLVWNYTRGIDSGEVIYALNYNIQEKPDSSPDGIINAADAARMFPQGHGDAYGHYLTAMKGYYSLLVNSKFDWVPRIEAVNVLGKAVAVDYTDERKFAAAASAVARSGRQIFDLSWRQNYQAVHSSGWSEFGSTRENARRSYVSLEGSTNHPTRYWSMDHWASRVGQGGYLNWVVGNAILPAEDPIPTHEGIQKVDRLTVPELRELTVQAFGLQTALDNAEGGLSPLGIPEGGLVFDLNPNFIIGVPEGTHFEQVYSRALKALGNAVVSFDDAKDVTRLMRSEQDSLAELQSSVMQQELSYTNALVDLYGTPYPDDIGPGKTYKQGYRGPDLLHYSFVNLPEYDIPEMWNYSNTTKWEFGIRDVPAGWATNPDLTSINLPIIKIGDNGNTSLSPRNGVELQVVETTVKAPVILGIKVGEDVTTKVTNLVFKMDIGPHGFGQKPKEWAGKRASPGEIQQAISEVIAAHTRLRHEINDVYGDIGVIDKSIQIFNANVQDYNTIRDKKESLYVADQVLEKIKFANDLFQKGLDSVKTDVEKVAGFTGKAIPASFIAGLAAGGDLTSAARAALELGGFSIKKSFDVIGFIRYAVVNALELAVSTAKASVEFYGIEPLGKQMELRSAVENLVNQLGNAQERWWAVNERVRELDDAQRRLQKLIADGDRIQSEREVFRRRSAALVQGYRTRDAAFRLFRNEKLERYKTLFDLSARYSLLAANAFDYETGLLGTKAGLDFKGRIIGARALGVVNGGVPQFAGSNTGDAGLSGALAEMRADWDVLRGRLGFNVPDAYHTTASLRTEKERILPGTEGDTNWRDVLNAGRVPDILADPDVRRYCMQVNNGDGLPVPGIILTFRTTITDGLNLFGQPLAGGDHAYSPSSYATKLYGVGVALEGYHGLGDPEPNEGTTEGAAAPPPAAWFLDPEALAANPYVYLIPVGVDSMRSPPLGDVSTIRTWSVQDLAIPVPFNIGGSEFSTRKLYQSADSLTEELFSIRKHQAFRPVSDSSKFELVFYSDSMPRFEYVNNRLIGRSVWNSQWKLVIPGRTLLADPNEGLDRLIRTVKDIKLHFQTYSYSGN